MVIFFAQTVVKTYVTIRIKELIMFIEKFDLTKDIYSKEAVLKVNQIIDVVNKLIEQHLEVK